MRREARLISIIGIAAIATACATRVEGQLGVLLQVHEATPSTRHRHEACFATASSGESATARKDPTMKRKTPLFAAAVFASATTIALTASAQQVAPTSQTQTPAAAAPTTTMPTTAAPTTTMPTSKTTLTAADTGAGMTAGMTTTEPVEPETVTVSRGLRPNRPLLITGGLLLVATYVPTAVIANTEGRKTDDSNLLIPIVGPWLNLADRKCDGCDNETRNIALVLTSGILQGIGTGMTVLSFFVPEKVAAATIQAGPVKFQVAPTQIGRAGMGLGSVGVF